MYPLPASYNSSCMHHEYGSACMLVSPFSLNLPLYDKWIIHGKRKLSCFNFHCRADPKSPFTPWRRSVRRSGPGAAAGTRPEGLRSRGRKRSREEVAALETEAAVAKAFGRCMRQAARSAVAQGIFVRV